MELSTLSQALFLGLLANLHCLTMCGPIALAVPLGGVRDGGPLRRFWFVGGRVLVYALMGALAGGLGLSLTWLPIQFPVFASVLLALVLYLVLFGSDRLRGLREWIRDRVLKDRTVLARPASLFALGMANGMVPCGLVYTALALAALRPGPLEGAVFMVVFGFTNSLWHVVLAFGGRIPILGRGLSLFARPQVSLLMLALGLFLHLLPHDFSQKTAQHASPPSGSALIFCKKPSLP